MDLFTPPVVAIVMLPFGLVFGSFANVVIWRFPRGESVIRPGSRCPACGHSIRWYDNIPVASWFVLGARCRDCGAAISWRYPTVEAISGLLWGASGLTFGASAKTVVCAAFLYVLLLLAFIDLDMFRLPNALVAVLAGIGLAGVAVSQLLGVDAAPIVGRATSGPLASPLAAAIAGTVVGGGLSGALAGAYALVRGRTGLGIGDVKLLAAMGPFLGPYTAMALVVGSFAGAGAGIVVGARTGERGSARIPFGPFLAAGAVVTVFVGRKLLEAYLSVLGMR